MQNPLRHLSYANVVASLALFLALGGVSYAAIKLPAGSVGSRELKSSAVTSAKVKDRSLLAKDFKKGQLPAGKAGAKGAPGTNATLAGVVAGGALSGTFPNPGIAPGAVTGAAVADDSLTGADIDESTLELGLGLGKRLTSGADIAPGTTVTLFFDAASASKGELTCDANGIDMHFRYATLNSRRVSYENLREGQAPVVASAVVPPTLDLPLAGDGVLRLVAADTDGAIPIRTEITNLKAIEIPGCSYFAETRVG